MRAVNLLPRETRASRSVTAQNLPAVVGGGVGFLVVAALAGGYLSASSKVASAQQSLTDVKARLAATPLPPVAQQQVDTTPAAVSAEQAPRLAAVSTALSQRIAWDRLLREFSLVLPNDVWVGSLTMNAPIAGSTNGFTLNGTTYSYNSVARMLSRMALIPDLSGVTLTSANRQGRLVLFAASATIKGAAPAPVAPPVVTPPPTDTTSGDTGSSS